MHGTHLSPDREHFVLNMHAGWKHKAGRVLLMLCFLALLLSLAACGDQKSVSSPGAVASTTHPPQFQLSTPPPVATVSFQVYTGSGLSLNYPRAWVVRVTGSVVSLSDASGTYNMTVSLTSNARGQISADQLAKTSLASIKTALSHPQSIAMSPTISLAGTTWSQQAVSGMTLSNGVQVEREVIVLATNHPAHAANTRGVVLVYMGIKQSFAQARNTYFVPMLRTFTFLV